MFLVLDSCNVSNDCNVKGVAHTDKPELSPPSGELSLFRSLFGFYSLQGNCLLKTQSSKTLVLRSGDLMHTMCTTC